MKVVPLATHYTSEPLEEREGESPPEQNLTKVMSLFSSSFLYRKSKLVLTCLPGTLAYRGTGRAGIWRANLEAGNDHS